MYDRQKDFVIHRIMILDRHNHDTHTDTQKKPQIGVVFRGLKTKMQNFNTQETKDVFHYLLKWLPGKTKYVCLRMVTLHRHYHETHIFISTGKTEEGYNF